MGRMIIVVPCYNEAARLDVLAFQAFAVSDPEVRFLFVNDGSTDATAGVLDALRLVNPCSFGVLHLAENCDKAEAVRRGVLTALEENADYIGYWDADLATPLRVIPTFRTVLDEHADIEIVIGSRVRLLGRRVERRAARHYLGRVFATAASLVLGVAVYDTQCGAKLFRASDAVRLAFQRPFRSRWIFDVELFARLIASSRQRQFPELTRAVYELPLTEWCDVGGSKVQATDFIRAGLDLLAIYRAELRPSVRESIEVRPSETPAALESADDISTIEMVEERLPGREASSASSITRQLW
jgi:dolichyl-phosphate beta-glucosyltransferase